MTKESLVTTQSRPKTIHDFYGFPEALFAVQYPAAGDPGLAAELIESSTDPKIGGDANWGLDHGTWSVLHHMYPEADIPVVQLSLPLAEKPEYHYRLGIELRKLRDQGVLVLGSGNIVHNLRTIRWETDAKPFDWALEFDAWAKEKLLQRDDQALTRDFLKTEAGRLSVPTPDHYLPLLYILGASDAKDSVSFDFEGIQNASISMRAVRYGA